MIFIYTNYGSLPDQPNGEIYRVDADSAQEADKSFLAQFGLKNFSQRECSAVSMYSPDWPVNKKYLALSVPPEKTLLEEQAIHFTAPAKLSDSPALKANEFRITALRALEPDPPSLRLSMLTPDISEM